MVDSPHETTSEELAVAREAVLAAPPALVWAIAGDTNRWDRVVRAGPSAYTTEEVAGEEGRQSIGHGQLAGMPASWLERGEWLEAEFLIGERRYLSGPLAIAGFRIEVQAAAAGTQLRMRAYLRPAQPIPVAFAAALHRNIERAAERYVGALDALFRGADLPPPRDEEPAAAYARRVLPSLPPNDLLNGGASATYAEHFERAADRLAAMPIDAEHRTRILDYIRTRPDSELEQVRPFELARVWHVKRRPLLRAFLHATTAGLFDLRWQLDCPRCRVGAGMRSTLGAVGRRAHCDMCDLAFDVDFAENVEAIFRANPAIRSIQDRVYCTSSPWFRPHVFAVAEIGPGETRRLTSAAAGRGFVCRTLTGGHSVVAAAGARRVVLDASGLAEALLADGDEGSMIELVNHTVRTSVLLLERPDADTHVTRGTDILTLPEFLDLYGAEAPASGAEISIGSVTVLFSDLTNTTEMYRSLGDARAFSLVQEHFHDMGAVVSDAGGAILKTMGDAVMASFAQPGDAVRAALRRIESTLAPATTRLAGTRDRVSGFAPTARSTFSARRSTSPGACRNRPRKIN
jgi:hypothetical protein